MPAKKAQPAPDDIWICAWFMTGTRKGFTDELVEADPNANAMNVEKNQLGDCVPEIAFPKIMYPMYPDEKKFKSLPDAFIAGKPCVSRRVVDALAGFDLGRTKFLPVTFLQTDRKTPIPGVYFCVRFGEKKEGGFVPEMSPAARTNKYRDTGYWRPPLTLKDDVIAMRESAREGVALWMDPLIQGCFFVTGEVAEKLIKLRLRHPLKMARCRVVRDN